jgi:hypothetical protein
MLRHAYALSSVAELIAHGDRPVRELDFLWYFSASLDFERRVIRSRRGVAMALLTVGRRVSQGDVMKVAVAAEQDPARRKALEDARKSLLEQLTPWIPGDFVVTYGTLLTLWGTFRASFAWLVVWALALSFSFVFIGAFAATGFTTRASRRWSALIARTIIGGVVSLVAAIAIPSSGWYDFADFVENEARWVASAALLIGVFIGVLKGLQKRYNWALSD